MIDCYAGHVEFQTKSGVDLKFLILTRNLTMINFDEHKAGTSLCLVSSDNNRAVRNIQYLLGG